MIDWHSHILPGMDDGSRDTAESLALLNMLREQGVDTVIATPHFYANDESAESFLRRRNSALRALEKHLPDDAVKIVPGAEVKYYQGISRMHGLKKLCIEGSGLLLLEMSMNKWTEYTIRELVELSNTSGMTVALAHIERYLKLQSVSTWDRLCNCGLLMQVNAGFFTGFATRRKALSMLANGEVHLLGSDCHNVTTRAPRIGRAVEIIRKKLGDDFMDQMDEYGRSMFQ